MTDLEKAKQIFDSGEYTAVFCKGDQTLTCTDGGVRPLINLIESGKDLTDFSVCDKVVGRAAAFLYVILGVKEVHSPVMAKLAIQILDRAEIKYSADLFVDGILNKTKTAPCKMEDAVVRSGSPVKALEDLKSALAQLSAK